MPEKLEDSLTLSDVIKGVDRLDRENLIREIEAYRHWTDAESDWHPSKDEPVWKTSGELATEQVLPAVS